MPEKISFISNSTLTHLSKIEKSMRFTLDPKGNLIPARLQAGIFLISPLGAGVKNQKNRFLI